MNFFVRLAKAVFLPAWTGLMLILDNKGVLLATTKIELKKRYSGSFMGKVWVVLYPTLFLAIYLFVYLVVFKMRFPGYSELDYVVYVFSGLVPFIGLMESLNTGVVSIKQNMHLVKNILFPIELIPVRVVLISMVSEFVGLGLLLILAGTNGSLSFQLVMLAYAILLQFLFLMGLVWFFAAVGILVPDMGYFVGLFMLFLLFVSPIGFKPDMVSGSASIMVYGNPVFYMTEPFRISVIDSYIINYKVLLVSTVMSVFSFILGAAFFHRFKMFLVDYE